MTVFLNQGKWGKSNVVFQHGRILAYDKAQQTEQMQHIDYGLGIFNHTVFNLIPDNRPYDLAAVYQQVLVQNALSAFEVSERFYEIGSQEGINEMNRYISQK